VLCIFFNHLAAVISVTQPDIEERFGEGIRLFNQGNFFEAHEVWEQQWRKAEGAERIFYQGMIQAAVALAHAQRGNNAGAISVFLKSVSKLTQFPALWMGIKLGQFRSELTRYFETLRTSYDVRGGDCLPRGAEQIAHTEQPPTIIWACA
jgi:predicted metal-dependent hydrolase